MAKTILLCAQRQRGVRATLEWDGRMRPSLRELYLEKIPQELVVNLVVELDLRRLDNRAQQTRAAIGRCLFQVGVAAFDVFPEEFACPFGFAEVVDRRVDVVGQVAFGRA